MDIIVYGLNFFDKIFNFDYEQCYDWDKFVNSKSFKILIKREDIFYNKVIFNIDKRVVEYNKLSNDCDLLIIYCDELHYYHYNTVGKFSILQKLKQNKKIVYIFPGIIFSNEYQFANSLSWLKQCKEIYTDLNYKLEELSNDKNKEFLFDALMGTKRTHREFVYNKIINSKINQEIILSYDNNAASSNWFKDEDLHYNLVVADKTKTYSNEPVVYHGKNIWISHQIPISVYNQSAYSIITETEFDNGLFFPTEKIAKPIIAKRLFVVFSGVKYLKTLQNLGFETFHEIIDESYDDIENNEQRWESAWKSIETLSSLNQSYVNDKIRPILEHNFNHLMNFPFDDFVKKQCTEILVNRYYESQRIYT